jgi:hypothetical protein
MSPVVTFLESLGRDMRVQLGSTETGMTEKLLDGTQISTTIKQMSSRCVTKSVRTRWTGSGHILEESVDQLVNGASPDPATACTKKERVKTVNGQVVYRRSGTANQRGTANRRGAGNREIVTRGDSTRRRVERTSEQFVSMLLPGDNGARSRSPERNDPLLRSFTGDTNSQPTEVEIPRIESDDLADAKSRSIQKFDDGEIPNRDRLTGCCGDGERTENSVDLLPSKNPRKMMIGFRSTKPRTRIAFARALLGEPDRQASNSGRPTSQSGLGEAVFRSIPQPVAQKFEIDRIRCVDAARARETGEIRKIRTVGANSVRAETTLCGQVDREVAQSTFEKHSIIVTQPP